MTWAEFVNTRSKYFNNEFDQAMWVARIHLQALESAVKSYLQQHPESELRTCIDKAIEVYLEPDEQHGTPPRVFDEQLMSLVFGVEPAMDQPHRTPALTKRKWNVHFKDAEILTVYAVSADSALREAIEHYIDDGSERSTDEYVAEFMRLKSTATVEQVN